MHFHVATNIIKIWEVAIDAHKANNCQIEFLMHQYQTVQTMRFKKKKFSLLILGTYFQNAIISLFSSWNLVSRKTF